MPITSLTASTTVMMCNWPPCTITRDALFKYRGAFCKNEVRSLASNYMTLALPVLAPLSQEVNPNSRLVNGLSL
jgi:hypothetical protein